MLAMLWLEEQQEVQALFRVFLKGKESEVMMKGVADVLFGIGFSVEIKVDVKVDDAVSGMYVCVR